MHETGTVIGLGYLEKGEAGVSVCVPEHGDHLNESHADHPLRVRIGQLDYQFQHDFLVIEGRPRQRSEHLACDILPAVLVYLDLLTAQVVPECDNEIPDHRIPMREVLLHQLEHACLSSRTFVHQIHGLLLSPFRDLDEDPKSMLKHQRQRVISLLQYVEN